MTINTREDIKLSNAQIAWRAAQDIANDAYVNLGIGFPEMVARYQSPGRHDVCIIRGIDHSDIASGEKFNFRSIAPKCAVRNPPRDFF